MKAQRVEWKIPFRNNHTHLTYVSEYTESLGGITYKDRDYEFYGSLMYLGITWNNSTFNTIWIDTQSNTTYTGYSNMIDDVTCNNVASFEKNEFGKLVVTGTFFFKKHGQSILMYVK